VVKTSRVDSDFDWAWLRFSEAASTLEELVVIDGRQLRLNGREIVTGAGAVGHLAARRVGERWDVTEAGGGRLQLTARHELWASGREESSALLGSST